MIAFYAGSFDPFTIGHLAIAEKAMKIFGKIIIGIGYNESKRSEMSVEKRIDNIKRIFSDNPDVVVLGYEGLTVEAARTHGAEVLVRGLRNALDFEKEKELADINLEVFGMPTVFIPSPPTLSFVSSSMVRELSHFGADVSEFIPKI